MENLVKVGKTTRNPEERASELSSATGVPTPFVVAYDAYFDDCYMAEDYVHKKLEQKGFRLSSNREFFQAPLKEVINTILDAQQVLKSQQISHLHEETQKVRSSEEIPSEEPQEEQKNPWAEVEALADYHLDYQNFEEAYRLYKKAVNLGSKNSYCNLGRMTMNGWGCIEDEKEALDYLKKGIDNSDGRCYAELSLYHFKKDPKIGKEWFEKYLQSDSLPTYDPLRAMYIFQCCVYIEMLGKYQRRELRNSSDILLKYKDVLSPLKEELVGYATEQMKHIQAYPKLKPIYLKVAQDIKNIL
jgi:TPR repeat protein